VATRQRTREHLASSAGINTAAAKLLDEIFGERTYTPQEAEEMGYLPAKEWAKRRGLSPGKATDFITSAFEAGKMERVKLRVSGGCYAYRVKAG
jgi:hypothetical protein